MKGVFDFFKMFTKNLLENVFIIAEQATVNTGEAVTFHLKCGLELTEMLAVTGDE